MHHRYTIAPPTAGISLAGYGEFLAAVDGSFTLPADGIIVDVLAANGYRAELVCEDVEVPAPRPAAANQSPEMEAVLLQLAAAEGRVSDLELQLSNQVLIQESVEAIATLERTVSAALDARLTETEAQLAQAEAKLAALAATPAPEPAAQPAGAAAEGADPAAATATAPVKKK